MTSNFPLLPLSSLLLSSLFLPALFLHSLFLISLFLFCSFFLPALFLTFSSLCLILCSCPRSIYDHVHDQYNTDGQDLPPSRRIKSYPNGTLSVVDAHLEDEGWYSCQVRSLPPPSNVGGDGGERAKASNSLFVDVVGQSLTSFFYSLSLDSSSFLLSLYSNFFFLLFRFLKKEEYFSLHLHVVWALHPSFLSTTFFISSYFSCLLAVTFWWLDEMTLGHLSPFLLSVMFSHCTLKKNSTHCYYSLLTVVLLLLFLSISEPHLLNWFFLSYSLLFSIILSLPLLY